MGFMFRDSIILLPLYVIVSHLLSRLDFHDFQPLAGARESDSKLVRLKGAVLRRCRGRWGYASTCF